MAVSYSLDRPSIFRHFRTICVDYLLVSKQPDYQNKTTDFNVDWILVLKSKTVPCTKINGICTTEYLNNYFLLKMK